MRPIIHSERGSNVTDLSRLDPASGCRVRYCASFRVGFNGWNTARFGRISGRRRHRQGTKKMYSGRGLFDVAYGEVNWRTIEDTAANRQSQETTSTATVRLNLLHQPKKANNNQSNRRDPGGSWDCRRRSALPGATGPGVNHRLNFRYSFFPCVVRRRSSGRPFVFIRVNSWLSLDLNRPTA